MPETPPAATAADEADLLFQYDPFAPASGDVPYALLHEWRARFPIAKLPTGYYFASRHDDIHAALQDGGPAVDVFSHEGKMRALDVVVPEEEKLIGEVEGPRCSTICSRGGRAISSLTTPYRFRRECSRGCSTCPSRTTSCSGSGRSRS